MRFNITKLKALLIALLLGLIPLAPASELLAQVKTEKGYKGYFCNAEEKETNCISRLRLEFEKGKSLKAFLRAKEKENRSRVTSSKEAPLSR